MIKTKIKEKDGCSRVLSVEVPEEEVSTALDKTVSEMSRYASVPGFRTGKAPKDLVMVHYGEKIKDEALKRIISDSYQEALTSLKLTPVSMPQVHDLDFQDKKPLRFNLRLEVKPEIKLKELKSITINKKRYAVKEPDIDNRLNSIRESNAEFLNAEDRAVENMDYVIADVECFVGGLSKEKASNVWLFAKGDSEDEIARGLIGLKRQSVSRVIKKLPDNYPKEDMRSKDAEFVITVKEIKKKVLPGLDDEFGKLVGNFASLGELRTSIKKSLEIEYQRSQLADMHTQIIDSLNSQYDFCVPQSLIDKEIERIKEQLKQRLVESRANEELIKEKIEKLAPSIKEDAAKNVKVYLVMNEIANTYSVEVSEEELSGRVEAMAAATRQDAKALMSYIVKNDLADDIKLQIRHDKVFDFIISKAHIEEEDIEVAGGAASEQISKDNG